MDTTYPREGTETYFCFALLSLLSNLTQLIPARGRKRFDLLFFRHLYPTQLIPARGRKRLRRIGRSSRVPDTTYPREGTETPTPPQSRQSGRTQLIPARGRKRCGASGGQAVCRDTTYPREGTETYFRPRGLALAGRHNLSPRGDGNVYSSVRAVMRSVTQLIPARGRKLIPKKDGGGKLATQLIPARGRKPGHWVCVSWCCIDTTYPREGTETHGFATHRNLDNGTQLIPARGRKRLPAAFEPNFRKTQLIPARGRKPGPERGALLRLLDTTYPREGTETPYRAR